MANKKVSQLTSKPSVLTTDLFPIADPSTGQLFKTTISDLGTAIGSGVSSVNGLVGAVVLDTDDIQELVSPTNKWFTDTRARAALTAASPLAYNSGTGVFSLPQANGSTNGFLSSADWTTFNAKQTALNGTGFVKISGSTISYDNSTYLTTSSAASTYLALTGGTLTGALNGTRLSLSQNSADITLSIGNAGTGRAFSVLGTSYFSTDIQLGYATNAILKTTALGFITSAVAGTDYQAPLSGTGFVKISGSTISYDNSTYALDSAVVKLTGAQTVAGVKTMSNVFKLDDTLQIKNIAQLSNSTGYTGIWAETAAIGFYTGANAIRLLYTGNYNYTMPASDGTLALTSQLSAYLPLAGGTLTGALSGTSALFSGAVRANNPSEGATGEGLIAGQSFKIDGTGTSQRAVMYMVSNVLSDTYASGLTAQYANFAGDKAFGFNLNTSGGFELYVKNTTFNKAITVANTGAVTLTSALSGTSATFTGSLTGTTTSFTSSANILSIKNTTNANGTTTNYQQSGTNIGWIGNGSNALIGGSTNDFTINGVNSLNLAVGGFGRLTIASTGAATFSSSVQASTLLVNTSTSPGSAKLAVLTTDSSAIATVTAVARFMNNGINYIPKILISDNNTADATICLAGGSGAKRLSFGVQGGTSGYEYLNILESGNVGIGTTSPSTKLTVYGGYANFTDGTVDIYSGSDGSGGLFGTISNHYQRFVTNNTERMRITSGGNVLIGTTTDAGYRATFDGGSNYTMYINQSQGNAAYIALNIRHNATTGSIRLVNFVSGSTDVGSITTNGTITAYNVSSDYRLKEDLKSINGLEIINKINVYDYKYKSSGMRMDGVLAHELQEILPYAVTGVKDGEQMQSVDYSKIVPVLIQSIKELKSKIETLENK